MGAPIRDFFKTTTPSFTQWPRPRQTRNMPGDRRTSGNFVPLRPAPSPDSDGNSKDRPEPQGPSRVPIPDHAPPKRKVIAVACDNCRARRSKCGGQRPRCHLCAARGETCVYEAHEGESVSSALKRKLHNLEVENALYKELYQLLKTKPDTESAEILRRI